VPEPVEGQPTLIRKMLPYTTVGVVLAAIYCGFIFYSRWSENREAVQKAKQQELAADQKTVDAYGGGKVKIMAFTLSAGAIHRGDKVDICYGVANAKTVTIDPKPDGETWPSLNRCVEAQPKKDTTYTLTATDEKGQTDTQSLAVRVQ
jgi:hypothetical protein